MQPTPTNDRLFTPALDDRLIGVAELAGFTGRFFTRLVRTGPNLQESLQQAYAVGIRTLPLISLTGLITGIVLTQQSRPSLAAFGAQSWLPSLVMIGLIRSLAPLVTALVCAGKVGSSIGAEIGSMKVTEQLEAMEVSAVDPFGFLVVTRTLATTLMVPALAMYFAAIGTVGAYINIRTNEGISLVAFLDEGFASLSFLDLSATLMRCVVFGFTIGLLSSWAGFTTSRGTKGVGEAANNAVVWSMLAVFLEEVLMVQVVTLLRSFA